MAAKKKRASREDRQVRAQHRRDQKSKMKQALTNEDGDFYSLQKQLQALGLALREIEGDGWGQQEINVLLFVIISTPFQKLFVQSLFWSTDRLIWSSQSHPARGSGLYASQSRWFWAFSGWGWVFWSSPRALVRGANIARKALRLRKWHFERYRIAHLVAMIPS